MADTDIGLDQLKITEGFSQDFQVSVSDTLERVQEVVSNTKTKWQTKTLERAVNASQTSEISGGECLLNGTVTSFDDSNYKFDISYSGLDSSKTYRISWAVDIYADNSDALVQLWKNGFATWVASTMNFATAGPHASRTGGLGGQLIMEGVTSLEFKVINFDNGDTLEIGGWSMLEELPMHIETTEW